MTTTLSYLIFRFANGILAILTLSYFTRLLNSFEYGAYAIFVTISLTTSSIFFYWLTESIARFFPNHHQNPSEISTVIAKWFWTSTAVASALFIAAFPLCEKYKLSPIMFFAIFVLTVAHGRYSMVMQITNSQNSPIRYGLLSLSKSVLTLLFGVVLIKCGLGGHGALIGFLVGIVFAILIFEPQPRIGYAIGKVNSKISTNFIRYGLPLTFSCLGGILVDFVDRLMIGSIIGVSSVAPYAIAYDFIQLTMGPVLNVIMLSTFPLIVKTYDSGKYEESNKYLHDLGVNIIAFGLPLVVGVVCLSEDISKSLFGKGFFQESAMILPWLTVAIFVGLFKSYYLDLAFQLRHSTKYLGYIALIMAVVNILINLLFLSRYGLIAAAWATLGAYLVGAFMSSVIGRHLLPMPCLNQVLLKCISASFVMAFILYLMSSLDGIFWLIAKVLIASSVYGVLGLALNIAGCRRFVKHYVTCFKDY